MDALDRPAVREVMEAPEREKERRGVGNRLWAALPHGNGRGLEFPGPEGVEDAAWRHWEFKALSTTAAGSQPVPVAGQQRASDR